MKGLNKSHHSLSTLKLSQTLSAAPQKDHPWFILILGEVSEQKPRVPEHSQRFKSFSAAPEQDNTRVTLIIGENSEQ